MNTNESFSFLYLNLKPVPTNLTPRQSSHVTQTKQIGTTAKWFKIERILGLMKLLIVDFMHKNPILPGGPGL